MIGRLLGNRYEILERVGAGGWAMVYRARDTYLGRMVAVKVLRDQYAADEEFVKRFRREAQAVASLSHPNIVGVYDVGHEGDIHFIVMEFVDGMTLKEWIDREGPLALPAAVRIGVQILDALEHAHQNRVVHRDIKPHNIMITKNGRVKVADFGIARAAGNGTLAYTDSIVGSAHYFSPEQARGGLVGEKSDLYSVGVVLYEMVTGDVPFGGESPIAVAIKHIQEDPVRPTQINLDLPVELEKVILRAMDKDQNRRYQTARDMLDDLNDLLRNRIGFEPEDPVDRPHSARPPVGPPRPPRQARESEESEITRRMSRREGKNGGPRKPRGFVWVVLALLIFLALGLGYWSFTDWMRVPVVKVPPVVGKSLSEADQILATASLRQRVVDQRASERPKGEVIEQRPEAGQEARQGREIELVLSSGPELVEVPPVVGKSLAEAVLILDTTGLKVGQRFPRNDPSVPPDTVIEQSPRSGTGVVKGVTYVDLTFSTGKAQYSMPSLSGLNLDEARQRLDKLKLATQIKEVNDSRFPPSVVIDQTPKAGERVVEGDKVELVVNRGAARNQTVQIVVPKGNTPIEIMVTVSDTRGTTTAYRRVHQPNEVIIINLSWVGESALYSLYANGSLVGQDILK